MLVCIRTLSWVTLRLRVGRRDPRKQCLGTCCLDCRRSRACHTPMGWMPYPSEFIPPWPCHTQMILKINYQWASEYNLNKLAKRRIGKAAKLIVYGVYLQRGQSCISWLGAQGYSVLTVTCNP